MSEEKTVEDLQAELEALKKARIEKEIAKEKAIVEAEEEKKKEEELEALRQEGYRKAMDELAEKSKITETKEQKATLEKQDKATKFAETFVEKNSLSGLRYEDLIKELVDGKGKAGILRDISNREKTWRRY